MDVKILKFCKSLNPGEVAAFSDEEARRMIKAGDARELTAEDKAEAEAEAPKKAPKKADKPNTRDR